MKTVERCMGGKRIEGAPAWGKKERKEEKWWWQERGLYRQQLPSVHYGKTSTDSD